MPPGPRLESNNRSLRCLISPHQTAIALDIRCEDRGRLSFDGVRFQGSGWFTEGFDTADLKEAKALLAELA